MEMIHMYVLFQLIWWLPNGVFAKNVSVSVSVTEGDNVTLNSGVTEIHKDDILWNFVAENSLIAKITTEKQNFTFYGPDRRFKDRLKLDSQTGSLTIMNIRSEHAGDYKLDISGSKLISKTYRLSVYARLPVPVLIFNSSQCSSSQYNCSVVCSVVNVSAVSLSWYKGNSLLSSISVSDLSISLSLPLEVEYQDKNTYSCVINNTISNQTTHLNTLCQKCEANSQSHSQQDVHVQVLTSAAGCLLIVCAIGIIWIHRKCRKPNKEGKCLLIADDLNKVCLGKETRKTYRAGGPPGTGLRNTAVEYHNSCDLVDI
ncbi:uncharacterized protein LOC130216610 [Danio aesculapii]|uniref:uncharacterized protein LOC130216610 n=1 Tax=Danio aesculapii TaxID=1142201 RepID=UPI0024C04454|nr:uncharacterized protein LOC130216610 [Danio aesculapii]